MTAALWRAFAWRAFWLWAGVRVLALIAIALVAAMMGVKPPPPGVGASLWMVVMTATVLALDIMRNRERLLLHDLGVRMRAMVPLATLPVVPLEAALLFVRLNAG